MCVRAEEGAQPAVPQPKINQSEIDDGVAVILNRYRTALMAVLLGAAGGSAAQQMIVYPAKGQSPEQQRKDQGECQVWATQSTGIDPVALAQSPPPQETGAAGGGGERIRGAAGGAIGGAVIGAIAGDTGKGAATGAVVGTIAGGRRARQNQAARNEQAQSQRQQQNNTWSRAVAACLEARGYTVR